MRDTIDFRLKTIAISVADTRSFSETASRMGMTEAHVRSAILELESRLCLHLFETVSDRVSPTQDGVVLIEAFREALRRHTRPEGSKS